MRPPVDEAVIAALVDRLPEFRDHYLDLLALYDEDLTPEIVVLELADLVVDVLLRRDAEELLERCLDAVEELAASGDGPDLVGDAFLNVLPAGARTALHGRLGPLSEQLAVQCWNREAPGTEAE